MHNQITPHTHSMHPPAILLAQSNFPPCTLQQQSNHTPCTLPAHSRYLYEEEGCLRQGRPPLRSLCPVPHSIPQVVSLPPPHLPVVAEMVATIFTTLISQLLLNPFGHGPVVIPPGSRERGVYVHADTYLVLQSCSVTLSGKWRAPQKHSAVEKVIATI